MIRQFAVIFIVAFGTIFYSCHSSSNLADPEKPKLWSKALGYPEDRLVLILHADDLGMCEEANISGINYLENDHIQSGSAMPPCLGFEEMIAWAKDNPDEDVGLHLTLTSEWQTYRWGSVADRSDVSGLYDPEGKLWREVRDVVVNATAEEVESEIRAQIEKSLALGYRPGHIDTHMGTLFGHPDFTRVYLEVAEDYNIPAMVIDINKPEVFNALKAQGYPATQEMRDVINSYKLPKLDYFYSVPTAKTYDEKLEKFFSLIKSCRPGLTEIIFHPSENTGQLKSITNSWKQRAWEAEMFSDPVVMQFLKEQKVIFTDWKEIMKRFNRSLTN